MNLARHKKMFFLFAIILFTSKLAAMSDGEGVCPFCGQFNFEIGTRFICALSGHEIKNDFGNAHLDCLKEQGLLKESNVLSHLIKNGAYAALAGASALALKILNVNSSMVMGTAIFLGTLCFIVRTGQATPCAPENRDF
jgi:hypothetical protein